MLLFLSGRRSVANMRSLIMIIQCLVLAGLLSACASETPWRTPIPTSSSSPPQASEECTVVGRLACNAMALGSSDGSGTCTRSRSGSTYVETCGTISAPVRPPQTKPQAMAANLTATPRSSVQLTWKDNSDNETSFVIERCDEIFRDIRNAKRMVRCRGSWKAVGSVGSNITTYVDDTVTPKQTYMYRVKAINQFGSSVATPEAVITAPVK